jgi:acyl-CoA synthetase (AMP-forming)/AMP-acid ligase II
MAGLLAPMVRRAPAGPAVAADRATLSWAELDARVNQWVDLFRGAGLGTGDRVAFVTGNRPVTFEALLACLHAGLVAVPVSWRFTAAEIAYLVADSGSRAVVTEPAYASKVADAVRGADLRPAIAVVAGDHEVAGLAPAEKALAGADPGEPAGQCSGSVMLYTSATTGRAKGVVTGLLAPGADLDRVRRTTSALGAAFGIPDHGRSLLVGPWYHAAQVFFSLFPLLRGCGLVLRQRFDAAATLADLSRDGTWVCHLVPTQFVRLLGLDGATRARFTPAHLRRVWHGGAACPVDVKRRMIEWWGPVLTEYYAATEAGIVTTIDSAEWLARPGSVGRPVPPTEVLVVGEDGAELPPGRTGAVYVRRSPRHGFEYHNAPDKTAAAYRTPGTFTVGDLGHVDRDGYLYLTGRTLDTIISGGVNIYPAEVEAALVEHPAIRDAAVFGVPDEEFGEQVMAAVVLEPGALLSTADAPEELDAHCRRHLAGYKRPRAYAVVGELPREPTGKLNRRALRDPYWSG